MTHPARPPYTTAKSAFNGHHVIEIHLRERDAIEAYINGHHYRYPLRAEVCHPGCLFGQWLHGEEPKTEEDLPLFNQLCEYCSDFHAQASEAITLKQIGKYAAAREQIRPGSAYSRASAAFQNKVHILHDKLHEVYRRWAQ